MASEMLILEGANKIVIIMIKSNWLLKFMEVKKRRFHQFYMTTIEEPQFHQEDKRS
jgi:hypothetical protein